MTRHPARLHLRIGGMQCSFCVDSIHRALEKIEGVEAVHVSLAHEEVLVQYDPGRVSPERIRRTLTSLGYTLRDPDRLRSFEEEEAELRRHRARLLTAAGFMLASLGLMSAMWLGVRQSWFPWAMLALAGGTVFGVGRPILQMAWASLRRGILNQHVLMELGAFGGLAGGVVGFFVQRWPAADFLGAAVFITAYHIASGYVSLLVRTRSSRSIRRLMDLQPATARVVRDGREQELAVEEVRRGDLVRVRPGERVPVDGEVVDGASTVDQSLVTGESMPVEKGPGDEVIGGSVNQAGTLLVRVTRVGAESFLQQVARSIEEARALKPGIIQLVDRVLRYFVPGVLLAAGTAFLVWTLGAWLVTGAADPGRAVFATLAALVMGYPCALGMAAPLAMIRGGGMAAERGILMRSGEAFQIFREVRKVLLDKTGTVTLGRPEVVEVATGGAGDPERVLALAAAAEAASEHPLARAVVAHAEAMGLDYPPARDFAAEVGRGVRATVDGSVVEVGSPRLFPGMDPAPAPLRDALHSLEHDGCTVVAVAVDGGIIGLIGIRDAIKPDAAEAVSRMKAVGLEPVMISGDNRRTARAVAARVGIQTVLAEILPQGKAEQVRSLQRQGVRVAMVGDGINDAPALMQADVGIAIGAGTDIAIEAADIVLISDRLGGVVDAWHISRLSYRKTVQNVILAFTFNGIGVPAAVTGLVHPTMAMIAMAASVTTVLLNSFAGHLLPHPRRRQAPLPGAATVVLRVPTMHCAGCLDRVEQALRRLPGVLAVDGDLDSKVVRVRTRPPSVDAARLCQALNRIGHRCERF